MRRRPFQRAVFTVLVLGVLIGIPFVALIMAVDGTNTGHSALLWVVTHVMTPIVEAAERGSE